MLFMFSMQVIASPNEVGVDKYNELLQDMIADLQGIDYGGNKT